MNKEKREIIDMFDAYETELVDLRNDGFSPVRITQRTLEKISASNTAIHTRRKFLRTALIAAALAGLMTVTAFAALYFNMSYRFPQKGEEQSYAMRAAAYEATMVVSFDTVPESYVYAFRANWLPSEPSYTWSLQEEAEDMARERLDMKFPVQTAEERTKADAEMAELFTEMGVSAKEAENWYLRYDADTTLRREDDGTFRFDVDTEVDIPYQIEVQSNLYNREILVGYDGGAVELVKEESEGDWQELWMRVDKNVPKELTNFPQYSVVLRFNREEGYLIEVIGTLDCGTLGKIAENVEVLRTDIKNETSEKPDYEVVTLGHG